MRPISMVTKQSLNQPFPFLLHYNLNYVGQHKLCGLIVILRYIKMSIYHLVLKISFTPVTLNPESGPPPIRYILSLKDEAANP